MSNHISLSVPEKARPASDGTASMISFHEWHPPKDALQPLSQIDWRVIEMARADGPRSLNPDTLAARFARFLRVNVTQPLANDDLEALRRFSVRAWYWDVIRTQDVRALFGAGYSTTHVLEILAHVSSVRGFTPSLQENSPPRSPAKDTRTNSSPCRCG